ncbi:uncharacterized protein DUF4184 [Pontibacter ummariensis]|uniref:DUF4184 family protein n=1 Tax=Pontibacter ummariensis TaxID=1610492 RepID=A0A239L968_9BACT|nr:DUF4184 family protein [Pontibacter ummariensis]PRY03982.1 uncharacterized protein DUF4184 [Pontibacter ummariensis]SNT26393.1 protein of unknown function [Pontibacter ummariensis]
MPFTFSHPAVVLPLKYLPKGWVSLTGLVVGSVVPDFEKFIKMEPGNTFSHTWHGLFWFNLPLGILLAFVFHVIVRNPLVDHLPLFLKKRLVRFKSFNWPLYFRKHYGIVMLSVLIGAFSHLVWDSFTHKGKQGDRLMRFFMEQASLEWNGPPMFWLVDNLSTVLGALVVFYAILQLPARETKAQESRRIGWYWFLVVLLSLMVIIIKVFITGLELEQSWELLFTSISAFLIGLTLASYIVQRKHRKQES